MIRSMVVMIFIETLDLFPLFLKFLKLNYY